MANGLMLNPVGVGHRAVVVQGIAGCVQGLQRLLQRPGSTQCRPTPFPRPHPALKSRIYQTLEALQRPTAVD